jgi:hypothetical protein
VKKRDQYYLVSSVIVAMWLPVDSVAHWNCFAEFLFQSLHSDVSVDNGIGDEGANALGDALKDNTTLTSLSLNVYVSILGFVGGLCFRTPFVEVCVM